MERVADEPQRRDRRRDPARTVRHREWFGLQLFQDQISDRGDGRSDGVRAPEEGLVPLLAEGLDVTSKGAELLFQVTEEDLRFRPGPLGCGQLRLGACSALVGHHPGTLQVLPVAPQLSDLGLGDLEPLGEALVPSAEVLEDG